MSDDAIKIELERNSARIAEVIENDQFPAHIEPDFLLDAVRDYPTRGGKCLRSALLSWSCGALGGNPETARFAAAAVEIYHNWTLVHDDIIDDDDIRRNHPSTHAGLALRAESSRGLTDERKRLFGRDFAILAGDIQQAWAADMLLKSLDAGVSKEAVLLLSRRLHEHVTVPLISGEALDVSFSYSPESFPSCGDVERMLALKTGALLRYCAVAGSLIALESRRGAGEGGTIEDSLSDPRLLALANFAEKAGTAFQLRDDWLGVFGDAERLGKPICSDIAEGKPTILFIETLDGLSSPELERFKTFFGRKHLSDDDIREIRDLTERSGAGEKVDARGRSLLSEAKGELHFLPASRFRELLSAFADFLVDRNS